MLVVGEAWDK